MKYEIPSQLAKIDGDPNFADYVPQEFISNPIAYFEERGVNIKSGVVTYDEKGLIDEDPTAVKDLPTWTNSSGQNLAVVGKRINTEKAQIKKTSDPFYEYHVMEIVQKLGLPAPRPILKVEQSGVYLIVMERVPGIRWVNNDIMALKQSGFSADDLAKIEQEAVVMMDILSKRYTDAGVIRKWKLRDMIFNLDIKNKKLISLTPVDWERTKLDLDKFPK